MWEQAQDLLLLWKWYDGFCYWCDVPIPSEGKCIALRHHKERVSVRLFLLISPFPNYDLMGSFTMDLWQVTSATEIFEQETVKTTKQSSLFWCKPGWKLYILYINVSVCLACISGRGSLHCIWPCCAWTLTHGEGQRWLVISRCNIAHSLKINENHRKEPLISQSWKCSWYL